MSDQEYLITLNVPPSLEEEVVDCLLTFEATEGFTSFPVFAHDHKNRNLTLLEQVTGRQKKIRFQMYVSASGVNAFIQRLQEELGGSGIHYWVLPVIEKGII